MAEPARAKPKPTPETQHFWDGTQGNELRLQRCDACANVYFPPRPFCPKCASRKVSVFKASGKAKLYSYVIHHRPVPGFTPPYAIAVVELDEGPRLMSNIVECPQTPEALELGVTVAMSELMLSGCTTTTDHHYVFPAGLEESVDIEVAAAHRLGLRVLLTRGSMNLSQRDGGLPPDSVVQDEDTILADSERVVAKYHQRGEDAMVQIALAPCSPFSVTTSLMKKTAGLAEKLDVRLHTHLAENVNDVTYSREKFGMSPAEYAEDLGWVGPDVWHAHCVQLDRAGIELFGRTGTGVAHCPCSNMRLASGIAPIRAMRDAGVSVGIGVDGSASNDGAQMVAEVRQALLLQRVGFGPDAMSAREALEIATLGGAKVLGRDDIGALAPGMAADFVSFDLSQHGFAGALHDPVAALVFCAPSQVSTSVIDGRVVVRHGQLTTVDLGPIVERHNRLAGQLIAMAN